MPDRTYRIIYDTRSAVKAASDISTLASALERLDVIADKVTPKLKRIAKGLDKSAAEGAMGINKLTVAVANLSPVAGTATSQLKAMNTQVKGANKALSATASSANITSTSIMGISAAALGLQAAREVVHALAEAFDEARKFAEETAGKTIALKDAVRELKAVSGDTATLKDATDEVKKIMLASGMKQQEAIDFSVMAGSALSVAKKGGGWQLNDKDTEEVKVEAARFAVANNIAPDTMGRLMGQVGVAQPVKTKDDVLSQLSFSHSMGVDSLAKLTPFMKANQALIGEMVRPEGGGAFKSFAELSGAVSGLSSVVAVLRIPQVLRQAQADYGSPANDQVASNFKKYGIVPGKDDFASTTVKIGKYLADARAQGVPNDDQALVNFGFPLKGGRRAIVSAVHSQKAITEGVTAAQNADPARIRRINDQFKIDQPNRFAEAELEVAKLDRGKDTEDVTVLRKFAHAGLLRNRETGGAYNSFGEALTNFGTMGGITGEEATEKKENDKIRIAILSSVPDAKTRFPKALGFGSQFTGTETLSKAYGQLLPAEKSAVTSSLQGYARGETQLGFDSKGELLNVNQKQLEALQNINAKIGGNAPGPAPSPPRNGPAAAPAGPKVGGDFNPVRQ